MQSLCLLISLIAALGHALPQNACTTTTSEVIVPSTTATYVTTPRVTVHATGAQNLGTWTYTTTLSTTKTLETITTAVGSCYATDTVSVPWATETVYTSTPVSKRDHGLAPRGCTVTVFSTTTVGQTQVWITANTTTTYTAYTAYTQATVTTTKTGGRAWTIATAVTTTASPCASVTVTPTQLTQTVTLDARCSPSAMISGWNGYGINYLSNTPGGGAAYVTTATDASACCQLCSEAASCAASAWDIRTGNCSLEFPVDFSTDTLNCGEGLLGYTEAGPNHPMSPGTGWYVAQVCGNAQFGAGKPDDGT